MQDIINFIGVQLASIYEFYMLTSWTRIFLVVPLITLIITLVKSLYTNQSNN